MQLFVFLSVTGFFRYRGPKGPKTPFSSTSIRNCFTCRPILIVFLYDRKNFAVVLCYDAVVVVVGVVGVGVVVGVSVCRQVGFRTITFVPVGRIF